PMTIEPDPATIYPIRQLAALPALESRIALLLIAILAAPEEVLKRAIQVTETSVLSTLIYLVNPRILLSFDAIGIHGSPDS
ncbi:MAG: hypothetical protein KJ734_04855, partial [Chloroflexi bacterium]|nr:hypothetical protein [Chloroflexota bacterium]